MFITIGTVTQRVSESSGQALLATGNAKAATAHEAAVCISYMIARGDSDMKAANDEFNATFGKK